MAAFKDGNLTCIMSLAPDDTLKPFNNLWSMLQINIEIKFLF